MGRSALWEHRSRLITAIYDAALDSTKWSNALKEICHCAEADEACLLFYDHQHNQGKFSIAVFSSPSISSTRNHLELKLKIPLIAHDLIIASLEIYRTSGSEGLSPEIVDFFKQQIPHLVKAMHLHNHLGVLKDEDESLLKVIQHAHLPVFLVDANMRVIFTSHGAQQVLLTHPALRLNRHMRFQAHINSEQLQLESILAELLKDESGTNNIIAGGVCLPLHHPLKTHPIKLCFLPLQRHRSRLSDGLPCLAVFANDPERRRFISPHYLQKAYGLTVTETHLAQMLLTGLGITDISTARGTSHETTRWQIKQIMHKTQTHSQTELTRLLILLTNDFSNEQGNHYASKGNSPALTNDSRGLLQNITPHLCQAMHIRQRITTADHANHVFKCVLNYMQLGVILLDADYRINFINPAAKNSLFKPNCFAQELQSIANLTHAQWNELFAPATNPRRGKRVCQGTSHCIKLDYTGGQLKINAFRLDTDVSNKMPNTGLPKKARYLLLVQDSQRPCKLPLRYLESAYAITPAEAELIYALANGATLNEAAEKRAVTKETARWQLKHIMQKTATHSQTELTRLMLALCDA
jgi:DNA-binding CsgD family transcriptional regulator